jgi:hypothetical protein
MSRIAIRESDVLELNLEGKLTQDRSENHGSLDYPSIHKALLHDSQLESLPTKGREFFKNLKFEFKKIRQLPASWTAANNKALSNLRSHVDSNDISPILQQMFSKKDLTFGTHRIFTKPAAELNEAIHGLTVNCAKECQTLLVSCREKLEESIKSFDIRQECIDFAQTSLIALCGGEGKLNFIDRNKSVIITLPVEGNAAGSTRLTVSLSSAIATCAFLISLDEHENDIQERASKKVDAARLKAEKDKAKSAAMAAAEDRPSAEASESIRTWCVNFFQQEIAKLSKQLHLNQSAARSQSPQRTSTAISTPARNAGRGRGRGGHVNQANHPPSSQTRNAGRGRGDRGQRRSPSPSQDSRPPKFASQRQSRRDSSTSPPPASQPRNQSAPRPQRSRASLSPARPQRLPQRRSERGNRNGRGENQGSTTTTPIASRDPSPVAGRGGRGQRNQTRGKAPRGR